MHLNFEKNCFIGHGTLICKSIALYLSRKIMEIQLLATKKFLRNILRNSSHYAIY